MAAPSIYRRPPRGRPLIGFQLDAPRELELRDGPVLTCREVREDGKLLGELEVSVFGAALIIDRDGILAELVREVLEREVPVRGGAVAVAVRLPGASGFRADAYGAGPLPYVHVFAMAAALGVDGGVQVIVRSSRPEWPAADRVLQSLRILTRHGTAPVSEDVDDCAPILPILVPPRD